MEPVCKRVEHVPVVRQVSQEIRTLIQKNGFPTGEKLPAESALCQSIGVSRGTVREAYRLLEAEGVVEIRPGRGAFVAGPARTAQRKISAKEMVCDCMQIRMALEPQAAYRFALYGTEEATAELLLLQQLFCEAVTKKDMLLSMRCDERFHMAIVAASGNRLLAQMNQEVAECVKKYHSDTASVTSIEMSERFAAQHQEILNAALQKDAQGAAQAMRRHLQAVMQELTDCP